MSYKVLRDNLATVISAGNTLGELSKFPKFEFNQYPAAFIVPSGNEADYNTNIEHERIYPFVIWIFEQLDESENAVQDAYDRLLETADDIIDIIDKQESPDVMNAGMQTNLPNYEHLINVFATTGIVASDPEKNLLGLQLTVRCRVLVDLQLIT